MVAGSSPSRRRCASKSDSDCSTKSRNVMPLLPSPESALNSRRASRAGAELPVRDGTAACGRHVVWRIIFNPARGPRPVKSRQGDAGAILPAVCHDSIGKELAYVTRAAPGRVEATIEPAHAALLEGTRAAERRAAVHRRLDGEGSAMQRVVPSPAYRAGVGPRQCASAVIGK